MLFCFLQLFTMWSSTRAPKYQPLVDQDRNTDSHRKRGSSLWPSSAPSSNTPFAPSSAIPQSQLLGGSAPIPRRHLLPSGGRTPSLWRKEDREEVQLEDLSGDVREVDAVGRDSRITFRTAVVLTLLLVGVVCVVVVVSVMVAKPEVPDVIGVGPG